MHRAAKYVVDHSVVFTRSQRRSLDAEPKDDQILVEAASYVSRCCYCRSGRILEPVEKPGVDAIEVQRKMTIVAILMMRISNRGLAAQAIPAT